MVSDKNQQTSTAPNAEPQVLTPERSSFEGREGGVLFRRRASCCVSGSGVCLGVRFLFKTVVSWYSTVHTLTYIHTCVHTYVHITSSIQMHAPTCLPAYLPTFLANYVPTCLPEYCVTHSTHRSYLQSYPLPSVRTLGLERIL